MVSDNKPKNTDKPDTNTNMRSPSETTPQKPKEKEETLRESSKKKGKEKVVERESKMMREKRGGKDEGICKFAFSRVKRIAKCEDSDMQISNDALFLFSKATEKFLETLTEEAYACSLKDGKKSISYKHLSNVVHNEKRYEFLSDFVPEMLKAEDALAALADHKKTMELKSSKTC